MIIADSTILRIMAAQNAQPNPAPPLQIPPRGYPPPRHPAPANPQVLPRPPSGPGPDGSLGGLIDPGWFKVVIMRCTAGLHEGAASVTLDRWQGTWHFLPNEFVESALNAASSLPIQHLILKQHKLTSLPANFAAAETLLPRSLTTLDLSFNCFTSLPPVVCQLVELRELYLRNNRISSLPDEMANLKHLQILHLQYNQLEEIPTCMCGLVDLRQLNLENNKINSIPPEVCQLSQLKELYLKSNQLKYLPDSINQLSRLEELYLTDNLLKALPSHLEGLVTLKQLHLANNRLRFLPLSIINLRELQGLTLSGNKLKFPPISACRQGISGLQKFMLECYQSSSSEWTSPDGKLCIKVSENLYYDSGDDSGNETPYEDLDSGIPTKSDASTN